MFTRNRWLVVLFSTVLLVGLTASRVIAATLVSDQDMPVSGSVPNACTGNTDTFSDIVHVHAAVTLSPSGTVHADINIHSSDLKLQDATVGACSGQASLSISINTTRAALPVVITQHLKAQFECPGSANNYSGDEQAHITINPDGTVTSSFDNFDVGCQ